MGVRRRLLWCGTVLVGVGAALLSGASAANADTGAKGHSNGSSSTSGTSSSQGKSASADPGARASLAAPPLPRSHSAIGSLTARNGLAVTVGKPSNSLVTRTVPLSLPQPALMVTVRVPTVSGPTAGARDWKPRVFVGEPAAAAAENWAQPTIAVAPTARMLASPAPIADEIAAAPRLPNVAARVVLAVLSAVGWPPRRETAETLVRPSAGPAALAAVSDRLSSAPPLPTTASKTALADSAGSSIAASSQVSGVVVGHSTLTISSGKGVVVRADWYFPTSSTPPKGLIYLQNGWLATKGDYNILAATLAEQTDSIVVVPTVSSSPLTCAHCWLGSDQMAQAVANLFVGNRDALSASAAAAGYQGTLPQKVVLAGHSAGGGLVVDAAGYMVDNNTIGDLGGVVLFDADPFVNMDPALAKLPDNVPVYQIASPPSIWNTYGNGTAQLVQARPNQFDGVMLVAGKHVDSMQSTNVLIELALQLVDGPSLPKNRQAVDTLAAGWIDDMYSGQHTQGVYGQPGQKIKVERASTVVLPTPTTVFTPLTELLRAILNFIEG